MQNQIIHLLVTVCLIGISQSVSTNNYNLTQSTPYTRLDASEILQTFESFQQKYPNYIKLKYINDNSTIDFSQTKCGKGLYLKNCLYFYAEISNFQSNNNTIQSIPQVLFTGGLQGNNTLGPNIVTYLAEYLLKNALSTKISQLLNERLIILYPIPNPQGFQTYNSAESQQNGRRINIEQDFPYFTNQTQRLDCLQSTSAKALTYLFQTYLFTIGASFTLGETPSITYPLPLYENEIKSKIQENIQTTIANHLKKNSPSNPKFFIPDYTVTKIDSLSQDFYKWANILPYSQISNTNISKLPLCNEVSLSQQSLSEYSNRSLMYKIQCSKLDPSEQTYGDRESSSNIYSDKLGHISRNIQLSMELIEMASPYVTTSIKLFNNHNIYLEWSVGGCFTVSSTNLYYRVKDPLIVQQKVEEYNDLDQIKKEFILASNFTNKVGSLVSDQNIFYHNWTFLNETSLDVIITATCDQDWITEQDPLTDSLFVQLRTNSNLQANNNGYNLTSKQKMIKKVTAIQSVQSKVSQEQQVKQLKEQVRKQTFQFWIGILAGLGGIIVIFIFISIYVKCRDKYRQSVDLKLLSPKSDALNDTQSHTQSQHHNTSEMNQLNLTKQMDIDLSKMDNDFINFASIK